MFKVSEVDLMYEDECAEEIDRMVDASSDEVLIACIDKLGRVDLEQMSRCSGKTYEQLVLDLRGSAILQDPAVFEDEVSWSIEKGWLLKAQYCCDNLRRKLKLAKRMNEKFKGCFDSNITALEKMLTSPINMSEIYVSPGAPWVPANVYALFIKELLKLKEYPTVIFGKENPIWKVTAPEEARNSVLNNMTYGTVDMSAIKIFEQTMNAKTVKVYDYVPVAGSWNYERVFNRDATLAAQEKQKLIVREFDKWIREAKWLHERLEECYNDAFVGYGFSAYDGSFLKFPDLNPEVELYPYQKSSIARMLLSEGNLLLAQDVGAGKTYIICTGIHELYRMNLSKKNMVVVPNNVLKATVDAHKYLYPNDKILAVFPEDFSPEGRQKTLEKIRDGNYVAIYMAYSSFDMIVMSKEYWVNKMQGQLNSLRIAISNTLRTEEKKLLEKQHKALSKKLSKYVVKAFETPWLTFDKLGIETLVVDEAHNYKNIPINSKTDNIVGMHASGSKKCIEMLEKTRCVNKLIFATGTPLTNSLADLFVLQTYLQYDELKFKGIDSFDMWINTFGERETNFEIDVDGKQLRAMTRFSTFHNLTELMALFSTVCDFYHIDKNKSGMPGFNGYRDICVSRTQAQTEYIKKLSERAELIRSRRVKRTEDNLLKITTDGRKCALDIRLVEKDCALYSFEKTKIQACAENALVMYKRFPDTCQVVFCDIGTPKASFNVYDCLKSELIARGIPEHQIAFIHDATSETARASLFAAVNSGIIRVVIGSTAKLGVGVNIQKKLIAAHHLDVPWRPADMVQREGRIRRQGNENQKVFIFRYVTEGSFDSYSWQLLENKQRFISSFLSGTSANRDADDVADAVLNYAEVKALAIGNPMIKKRVETANKLDRARIAYRMRQKQLIDLHTVVKNIPAELERLQKQLAVTVKDVELYKCSKEVIPQEERTAFGEELLDAIRENNMQSAERLFDIYQGFDVVLPANMNIEKPHIYIRSSNGGVYYLEMETEKPLGCAMRIDHLLEQLTDRVSSLKEQIVKAQKQKDEALYDIENGNPYQSELERLELELADIDRLLSETEVQSA